MTPYPHPPESSPLRVLEGELLGREAEAEARVAGDDLERLYRETVEVEAIIERLAAAGLRVTFDLPAAGGGVDVCVRDLAGERVMQLTPRDAIELDRLRALIREV